MKKTILIVIVALCACTQLFAHVAKKEVDKDDKMLKLDNQVRTLILENNDYEGALKLFASAARDNSSQPYYKDQYAILRRVIKMKRAMEAESMQGALSKAEIKKWKSYYLAIRGYYYDQGFYSESVGLDKLAVEKLETDQANINYIESLTILNKAKESEIIISKVDESITGNPEFTTLQNLLQQRMGTTANADVIEVSLNKSPQDNPRAFVYLGCIYQLQNNQKKALESIVKALENTPPTQITMTRKLINNMKEYGNILKIEKYQAAVKTESKIYQSGCTGGSSCNSCSLKDKCPSNK